MLTNILRLIAVIAWVVALLWFVNDRTYEPLLAFITGSAALIGSFLADRNRGGITLKQVKAGRDVKVTDRTGGGIAMDGVEAGQDVTAHEEQRP